MRIVEISPSKVDFFFFFQRLLSEVNELVIVFFWLAVVFVVAV